MRAALISADAFLECGLRTEAVRSLARITNLESVEHPREASRLFEKMLSLLEDDALHTRPTSRKNSSSIRSLVGAREEARGSARAGSAVD